MNDWLIACATSLDVEETVVAKVLASLTSLAELGLFQKLRIWELMSAATGFLYHPNVWIRQGAASFIASASKHLPATDVWCILYPSLRPLLRSDIQSISEHSLLLTLKPPASISSGLLVELRGMPSDLLQLLAVSTNFRRGSGLGYESEGHPVLGSASLSRGPRFEA